MLSNLLIKNRYFDSAKLLLAAQRLREHFAIEPQDLAIMMATPMNKRIVADAGLLTDEGKAAQACDILIAINTDQAPENVLAVAEALLEKRQPGNIEEGIHRGEPIPTSVEDAIRRYPESNLAIVSVPGVYAAREAMKLLRAGKHVFLFSNNVSIEDEVALKKYAVEHDLLMMGPDCGSAIIHGVGLGFANCVNTRWGSVGVVSASGTGLQAVTCRLDALEVEITQAIGVGSRDMQDQVGGLMTFYSLDLLLEDPKTDVIVVISKPPQPTVLKAFIEKYGHTEKPIVAVFLGADPALFAGTDIHFAETLDEAATMAAQLSGEEVPDEDDRFNEALALCPTPSATGDIRAIYTGGTLAYETLLLMQKAGLTVHSNLLPGEGHMTATTPSTGHVVLDMGDEEFTLGKPHPMLDPTERNARLHREAADPAVSTLLADLTLWNCGNDDAEDALLATLTEIRQARPDLNIVVPYCETSSFTLQEYSHRFAELGVAFLPSNAMAARLVIQLSTQGAH